ncbi:MAG: mechanosensitive ion channel family protein [Acidimicrobiia bacterium]|nr:mechanosensitive ion channel family protein [Acidimicrobiia bacterium]
MINVAQGSEADQSTACAEPAGLVCDTLYGWTNNEALSQVVAILIERGLPVVLILLGGWLVTRAVKRAIHHFTQRLGRPDLRDVGKDPTLSHEAEELRAKARAETLAVVLRSVALISIWAFTALLALAQININLGPLIAGAGIVGIAVGFGAQSVVRDFLSGVFMMIEDIYSVGDDIDFGKGRGTVEKITLRSTSIRTRQGVVWNVPNGRIDFLANYSQLWARAQIDVEVPYSCDLRQAMEVIKAAGEEMWEDPQWGGEELSEPPEVKGVQSLGESGILIRVRAKTRPSVQWRTERELRLRIKEALEEAGISMPFPHRTVVIKQEPAETQKPS